MGDDVHSVVLAQDQVVSVADGKTLAYGTCDPEVNLGEYLLTALMGNCIGVPTSFLVYSFGPQEYVELSLARSRLVALPSDDWEQEVASWLDVRPMLLDFVQTILIPVGLWDVPLREMAEAMRAFRPDEQLILAHTAFKAFHIGSKAIRNSTTTVAQFHADGGWLGGAGIHFALSQFSNRVNERFVWLAPWNDKGNVYKFYEGGLAKFVISPWLGILPFGNFSEWGLSFHPRCFGSLLKMWSEPTRAQALEQLKSAIFAKYPAKKVGFVASVEGLKRIRV